MLALRVELASRPFGPDMSRVADTRCFGSSATFHRRPLTVGKVTRGSLSQISRTPQDAEAKRVSLRTKMFLQCSGRVI